MYFVKAINDGQINGIDLILEHCKSLKDGFYSIEILKFGNRTNAQNAYLWGVLYKMLSEATGVHPDELHFYFKNKFIWKASGFPSSKELNKEEFAKFVEDIKNYSAMTLGVLLPDAES